MCRERLALGGTHPPGISGVRATEYKFPFGGSCRGTQVSLSWRDELSETRPPGKLRETVSRNASFAGETSVLGQQNLMSHESLAFGGTHPPDFRESVSWNTSFPPGGYRVGGGRL